MLNQLGEAILNQRLKPDGLSHNIFAVFREKPGNASARESVAKVTLASISAACGPRRSGSLFVVFVATWRQQEREFER
jgi:hypothetical protein